MRDFRFAHIADAHVGAWPKDTALRQALRASVLRALGVVERERCEFLVISGDFFHTPVPDPEEVAPLARALRGLRDRGIRVYAIYGSHDFVLHQTSWMDVLSEGGLFLRVAPPPTMGEGQTWVLPYVKDDRTGALLAGVSGRAQGLDRKHYETMNASAFLKEDAFKIFLFHAGIRELLPHYLAGKVDALSLERLPPGCGYYAGGHIHLTAEGRGPGGKGVLVNPGAVFGTSVTDLEAIFRGKTRAGVVIVDVEEGVAKPRWEITTPQNSVNVVDVDLGGSDGTDAIQRLKSSIQGELSSGALLVPRLHGSPAHQLDLSAFSRELKRMGAGSVHFDVEDLSREEDKPAARTLTVPEEIEGEVLRAMLDQAPSLPSLQGKDGFKAAHQLLRALGVPMAEGEAKEDYRKRMVRQGLTILGFSTGEGKTR